MIDILLFQPAIITREKISFGVISNGLIALGLYLKQKRLRVKICHFNGCTKTLGAFVQQKILQYKPKSVGINLTWHTHCYQALKIAEAVKSVNKNIKVCLGGFTASFFDKEILDFVQQESIFKNINPYIDCIIRGDGEKPLFEFITKKRIPKANTSYIDKNGNFLRNPLAYTPKKLPSVRLKWELNKFIDNWQNYIQRGGIRTSVPGVENKVGHNVDKGEFHLYVGKGCRNNCCYCGGGRDVQKLLFRRNYPIFRQLNDVIYDINQLSKNNVKTVYIDFDPDPSRKYYKKLFKKINKQNLNLIFSAWSGPIESNLLTEMDKIFNKVEIIISSETGSERLRKELLRRGFGKVPFYTNQQLVKFLEELKKKGFKAMVYFISGLPWETEKDWKETIKFGKKLSKDYQMLFVKSYDTIITRNLCAPPLYIEPGSPIYTNPDKFQMCLSRKFFKDYVSNSRRPDPDSFLGVYRCKFGSEKNVINNTKKFKVVVINN